VPRKNSASAGLMLMCSGRAEAATWKPVAMFGPRSRRGCSAVVHHLIGGSISAASSCFDQLRHLVGDALSEREYRPVHAMARIEMYSAAAPYLAELVTDIRKERGLARAISASASARLRSCSKASTSRIVLPIWSRDDAVKGRNSSLSRLRGLTPERRNPVGKSYLSGAWELRWPLRRTPHGSVGKPSKQTLGVDVAGSPRAMLASGLHDGRTRMRSDKEQVVRTLRPWMR